VTSNRLCRELDSFYRELCASIPKPSDVEALWEQLSDREFWGLVKALIPFLRGHTTCEHVEYSVDEGVRIACKSLVKVCEAFIMEQRGYMTAPFSLYVLHTSDSSSTPTGDANGKQVLLGGL
jgi:hypothetical protein